MIRYTSQNQMTIEEFKTPFEVRLNKENRWVKLRESMPWDALAKIYYHSMSSDMGAPAIDARIVIGAMIIKHKLKLDDRETIETIRVYLFSDRKSVSKYIYLYPPALVSSEIVRKYIEDIQEKVPKIIFSPKQSLRRIFLLQKMTIF